MSCLNTPAQFTRALSSYSSVVVLVLCRELKIISTRRFLWSVLCAEERGTESMSNEREQQPHYEQLVSKTEITSISGSGPVQISGSRTILNSLSICTLLRYQAITYSELKSCPLLQSWVGGSFSSEGHILYSTYPMKRKYVQFEEVMWSVISCNCMGNYTHTRHLGGGG